jgi:hypothetical protein
MSSTIEEAETRIIDIWKNNSADQTHIMTGFYSMLKSKVPEELLPLVNMKPEKISIGIF